MKLKLILIITLLVITSLVHAQAIFHISNAICKVDYHGRFDTTVFCVKEDSKNYYLVSAGHTIDVLNKFADKYKIADRTHLNLTVNHNGTEKKFENVVTIVEYVYKEGTTDDFSLLSFPRSVLVDYDPLSYVVLAKDAEMDTMPNKLIWTYGYPNGGWPTALKGTILSSVDKTKIADEIVFYPPSIFGRSGSPLFNHDASKVIGMIILCNRKMNNDGSMGHGTHSIATPSWKINNFLKNTLME